jgi:hypothetical protein
MNVVLGLALEQPIPLVHQVVERRVGRRRPPAVRVERQLQQPLVLQVHPAEELLRVGGVDEHRDVQPRRSLPDGIKFRIVQLQQGAVRFLDHEAEVLVQLADAHGAGFHVGLELLCRLLAEARPDHVAEVDGGELHHPVAVFAALDRRQALHESIARDAGGVHQNLQVQRVHGRRQLVELLRRHRVGLMAVDVDHRELGAGHGVLWHHQGRARFVFPDVREGNRRLPVRARPTDQRAAGLAAPFLDATAATAPRAIGLLRVKHTARHHPARRHDRAQQETQAHPCERHDCDYRWLVQPRTTDD